MMNYLKLEDRLKRIEQLLVANKEVLTLEEACEYTGIYQGYMYKLTCAGKIPHSKTQGEVDLFREEATEFLATGKSKILAL